MLAMPQRTRIKICGVRDVETARSAVEFGADAIGLVFAPDSPRTVSVQQAEKIVGALPAFVEPIGLFVDASTLLIRQRASDLGLRTVQLHGSEQPNQVVELAPLCVIKAIAFDTNDTIARLAPWKEVYHRLAGLLLDAPATQAPSSPPGGGRGRTFQWDALAELQRSHDRADLPPVILAGGLTPQNVARAIELTRPFAVDVSSGVESSRGVKDTELISSFCRAVRQADAQITDRLADRD